MPKRKRYLDNGGKPDRKTVYKAKYTGKIYSTAREAAIDNTRYLREPINRFDAKSKEYPRYEELNIPFIEEKRRTLSNAGLATGAVISENLLDSIAKYADIEGLPLKTSLGLVTKESTLGNPTDDKSVYKLLGEDKALFFKRGGGGQFINKGGQDVDARGLVNYYKDTWNPYEEAIKIAKIKATGSNGVFVKPVNWGNEDNPNYLEALDIYNKQKAIFDKTLIEGEKYADRQAEKKRNSIRGNVLQAAFRDYKNNPNGYNPGQRNYPQLVERRGNEVWNSPEIQNWYKNRTSKRNGGRISLRGGGKSSFVRNLETQPTILEQFAEYNKEPKIRKASKETVKQQRIREQKAANQRERNIAKQYLAAGPNIGNLVKAAYHWYNSIPILGGQSEDGNDYITGIVDVPGMRNPKSIIKGVSTITKANAAKITPTQWTAAQDAAIARGDMAEAQRLRDLHFVTNAPNTVIKNVDGTPAHVYHGTFNKGWNSYDKRKFGTSTDNGMYGEGLYATSDRSYADVYARGNNADGKYIGEVKDLYINGEHPFYIFNKKDLSPKEIVNREDAAYQFGRTLKVQDDIPTPIWNEMNSSDIVIETKGTKRPNFAEIVVPRGEQIKSADAVTYDNNGVRIPLGERDNFNINDIRYAIAPILAGGVGYGAYRTQKASGGTIHIAPSKRGTFTAAATRHGMGVQEFANTVLRNKDRYSPNLVKKANFARNASKWNH